LDLRFADNKTLGDAVGGGSLVTFARASTGTFVSSDGLLRTAAVDAPRFDHVPITDEEYLYTEDGFILLYEDDTFIAVDSIASGESLGLLVEEPRTNLLQRSEEFDNASWTPTALQAFGSGSVANAIASPSGSITADLITESTANSEHNVLQAVTVTVNTVYTLSCFAKKGTRSILAMSPTSPGVANFYTLFNLDTGAIEFNETGNTPTIRALGNGWYRCSITRTTGAAQVLSNNKIGIANNALSTSYTGDGTSGLYLWGAQLEAGAFPTSYILNVNSPSGVTRAADVASITGAAFSSFYNQAQGTVFAEARTQQSAIGQILAGVSTGSFSSSAYLTKGSDNVFAAAPDAAPANLGIALSSVSSNVGLRSALAFTAGTGSASAVMNGGTVGTDASTGIPNTMDRFVIGSAPWNIGTNIWNGTIKRLVFWPTRLANATLQSITQP
jgi:hypothetical protein